MDFVVGFPCTLWQHDSIWVIVDKLTKSSHFLPVNVSYSEEEYYRLYINKIIRLHGDPSLIIFDRGAHLPLFFGGLSKMGLVLK